MAVNPPTSDTGIVLPRSLARGVRSQTPISGFDNGTRLRNDAQSTANRELSSYRGASTAAALTRELLATDAVMSTSAVNMTALAQSGWTISTYSTGTQEFSPEGLVAAESVIARLDTRYDYTTGFSSQMTLGALIETAVLDVFATGGIGMELVLDKQKLPAGLVLFAYDRITKVAKEGGWVPSQRDMSGGPDVILDFPTIFVGESLMSLNRIMAVPMAHPGSNRQLNYSDFIQDSWRTIKRAGMGRLAFELDYDKVCASAPADVRSDPVKLSGYLSEVKTGVETELANLAPEDVLVHFSLGVPHQIGATGEKADIAALLPDLAGMAASAAKSNATLLGLRGGGSQNVASTEALIATKTAALLRRPVEDVLSQALTLAVRLFGVDVYVEFAFKPIELRPESELAAHRAMDQNRVMELLSEGRITDSEAQSKLGLYSLPPGAQKLEGTGFYKTKAADTVPASGTNALNRTNKVDGPSSGGGQDNAQRP